MRLSTFSSSTRRLSARTVLLLALLVVYAASLESVTRRVLSPASRIQSRVAAEIAQSTRLRPAANGQAKTVLLIGNSLLEAAVDCERLNEYLHPGWQAKRVAVSDTSYLDWRFGLVRLLETGAAPEAVAVMLSPRQLTSDRVRGSYFAYYLMRLPDLPAVAEAAHLHRTEASGMLLAHYSLFYGIRSELRNFLLQKLFPRLPEVLKHVPQPVDGDAIGRKAEIRLRDLNDIASRYGIRLVLVLPPSPAKEWDDAVIAGGHRTRVPVLCPVPAGYLRMSAFRDSLHANREGAAEYTKRLAPVLRAWLEHRSALLEAHASPGGGPSPAAVR